MPAFTRENSSLSQRFQGSLYTPFVYGDMKWPSSFSRACSGHRATQSTGFWNHATRYAMSDTEESLWERTTVQNLIRYRPSGTYFGRFRVGGKLVRQSLETAVFSVAKQRLPDKIRDY